MADAAFDQLQALRDLDARQDDLLRQIDALDRRVAEVLREMQPAAEASIFSPQPVAEERHKSYRGAA